MAYTLMGFIASQDIIRQNQLEIGELVPLPQQFSLLPITSDICSQFDFKEWPLAFLAEEGITPLTLPEQLALWGKNQSLFGKVGYIEVELFGGTGIKAGAVWHEGKYVLRPFASDDAINKVLEQIGVKKAGYIDEFTALNLASHG